MAGFRMHVTTSTVLGVGYAGIGHFGYGVPLDTAIVAGAMHGFSGMLPDLDSDHGVPLREAMCFTAAVVPMLLIGHFQSLALTHDQIVLTAVSMYLFVRFVIANMIRKYTVHRGMFHSIPTGLIFAGLAFLACGTSPFEIRCYKAGGVFGGFMSHLILDEIYSIEWKGGRWRLKKSFGTALKFWGEDPWSNFTTYAKLAIVAVMILGQPHVLDRLQSANPQFAGAFQQLQNTVGGLPTAAGDALNSARAAAGQFVGPNDPNATNSGTPLQNAQDGFGAPPGGWYTPQPGDSTPFYPPQGPTAQPQDIYDTARRQAPPYSQ